MLPLSIIVALADNNVIGINNQLPWHLPADLKHFKAVTTGKPIIMGRKTWQSLGHPLPNRLNLVVSRQADFSAEGAEVYPSLERALQRAEIWCITQTQYGVGYVDEIMLIGGAQLYKMALEANLVDKLYLTRIHLSPDGDAYFPTLDTKQWHKIEQQDFIAEQDKPAYTLETWLRKP